MSLTSKAAFLLALASAGGAITYAAGDAPKHDQIDFRFLESEEPTSPIDYEELKKRILALRAAETDQRKQEEAELLFELLRSQPGVTVLESTRRFAPITNALREAKTDKSRREELVKINQRLTMEFDEDMAIRKRQIADLESRVGNLKEQVKKRSDSRDKIIRLKLESIASEADIFTLPSLEADQGDSREGRKH